MKIKLIEEIDENVSIEWWKKNRKDINVVIRMFNEWQTEHKFNKFHGEIVIAQVELMKEHLEDRHFSDWQIEILNSIIEHIETIFNEVN